MRKVIGIWHPQPPPWSRGEMHQMEKKSLSECMLSATGEIDLVLLVHEKLKDRMRCATEVTTTIRVSVEKESCISSALKGIIITVRW